MDFVDASYLAAVTLAGCCARALVRGVPDNWRMRLEASAPDQRPGWIWVQAVSVGELMLAEGILARLLAAGHRIHVTTGTAAGSRRHGKPTAAPVRRAPARGRRVARGQRVSCRRGLRAGSAPQPASPGNSFRGQ